MNLEIDKPMPMRRRFGEFGWITVSWAAVQIGDRRLPQQMLLTLPGAGGQPSLQALIEVLNGVPRLTKLHIDAYDDGREIRYRDLRNVIDMGIDNLVEVVAQKCASRVMGTAEDGSTVTVIAEDDASGTAKILSKARQGQRRAMTEEHKRKVAEVYNAADLYALEDVQRVFEVSRATASRYVKAAREAGLIEEKKK